MVRYFGALLFFLGGGATGFCTWAVYNRGRPKDVLYGVLAPIAALVALAGLVLLFVPDFFG